MDIQELYLRSIFEAVSVNTCMMRQLCGCIQAENCSLNNINCTINTLLEEQCKTNSILANIQMSLGTQFPTVVQAEYPEITEQGIIYHYSGVLREIVGNIVVIFRGKLEQDLPVYLADATGYAHIVTAVGSNEQLTGNNVVVNTNIPAIYEGNYIHLQ